MTQMQVPPPQEALCLSRPYRSSQKGGTLIAESVVDLAEHKRRLALPGGYRPRACKSCLCTTLHVHDYRTRLCQIFGALLADIVRYRCTNCGGRWQILPAFIARHLWYNWAVVQQACGRDGTESPAAVGRAPSKKSRQRWLDRLRSSARMLVQVYASSLQEGLVKLSQRVGLEATRWDFLDEQKQPLSAVAALIHRLVPGVRLM